MAYNPNALSDAEYWAIANPPGEQWATSADILDLFGGNPNLAQTVAYGGFNPNGMTDLDYWNYVNQFARYPTTPQYYNPPAPAPVPRGGFVGPVAPAPAPQVPQTVPLEEAPYPPPEYMLPPFIRPPRNWAPTAALPYPYYGV